MDPVWAKLDAMDGRLTEVLISVERMAGDQRTANAKFDGQIGLMSSRVGSVEEKVGGHNDSDKAVHEGILNALKALSSRVDVLEGKRQFTAGKSAMLTTVIATIISVAGLAIGALKLFP